MIGWTRLAELVEVLTPLEREAVISELRGGSGAGLTAEHRQVLSALKTELGDDTLPAMLGALAVAERAETNRSAPSMVWTGMEGVRVPMRLTSQVVNEMIARTRQNILIVGYSLTRAAGFWEDLAALPAAVDVNIIGHNLSERTSRLGGQATYLRKLFAASPERLHLYTYIPQQGDITKLHAKLLVSDRQRALVTSANFTRHGMERNIEVGVTVGARQAVMIWDQLEKLVQNAVQE